MRNEADLERAFAFVIVRRYDRAIVRLVAARLLFRSIARDPLENTHRCI